MGDASSSTNATRLSAVASSQRKHNQKQRVAAGVARSVSRAAIEDARVPRFDSLDHSVCQLQGEASLQHVDGMPVATDVRVLETRSELEQREPAVRPGFLALERVPSLDPGQGIQRDAFKGHDNKASARLSRTSRTRCSAGLA